MRKTFSMPADPKCDVIDFEGDLWIYNGEKDLYDFKSATEEGGYKWWALLGEWGPVTTADFYVGQKIYYADVLADLPLNAVVISHDGKAFQKKETGGLHPDRSPWHASEGPWEILWLSEITGGNQ